MTFADFAVNIENKDREPSKPIEEGRRGKILERGEDFVCELKDGSVVTIEARTSN
jgi:hypothetical protein